MFRTIRHKLIAGSLIAVGIPLVLLGFFVASLLWRFYLQQLERQITAHAYVIADTVRPYLLDSSHQRTLAKMVYLWQLNAKMRVAIVDRNGIILAATIPDDVGEPVQEKRRPGVRRALQGTINSTVWKNPRFGNQDTMYVNLPIRQQGNVIGAVRVAYTLTQIQENLGRIRLALLAGVAGYALVIVLLTVRLAHSIVGPVERLNQGAQLIAAGDLEHRLHVNGTMEITQLSNTLNHMTQRLLELESVRRQFVSNVSHELRTPLAAIRGMAETLMQHGESDPEIRERYLPRITAQADRVARLADQLLDLAQVESGELLSNYASVTLDSVVEEASRTVSDSAAQKRLRVMNEVPAELPTVRGDRDRLVQVFLNLADNAIRHTPAGGRIRVSGKATAGNVVITISDTGEGIPPHHLPYIFDRFYRGDRARSGQSAGSGLGLAIVRQIVEAHGGTITVKSTPGVGSEFAITLEAEAP